MAIGQSSQSTYFPQQSITPDYVNQLTNTLIPQATNAAQQSQQFIANPTASPLFQNQLAGLRAANYQPQQDAIRGLADAFRGAGNMSSGQYGTAAANLQGNFARNDQQQMTDLLSKMFPEMVQALQHPQDLSTQLLQALKLSQAYGAPTGSSSSSISDPFGMLGGQAGVGGSGGSTNPFAASSSDLAGGGYSGDTPENRAYWDNLHQQLAAQDAAAPKGATMFMPGGQYVSGSPTSAGLYNPYALTGAQNPLEATNYGELNPGQPQPFSQTNMEY